MAGSPVPFSPVNLRHSPEAALVVVAFIISAPFTVRRIHFERRRLVHLIEHLYPEFEQRLITFDEQSDRGGSNPFLELLAADALTIAQQVERKIGVAIIGALALASSALISSLIVFYLAATGSAA